MEKLLQTARQADSSMRQMKTGTDREFRFRALLLVLLLSVLVVAGCGVYTLNPKGSSTINSIAVEPFENKTAEFGLGDRLTEVVIDAFIADGNMKVVSPQSAEARLVTILSTYQRIANQFDENDQVQTYKVVMSFQVTLVDQKNDTEIWKQSMKHEGVYDAQEETEEDGQRKAGERLVDEIISKTTRSW